MKISTRLRSTFFLPDKHDVIRHIVETIPGEGNVPADKLSKSECRERFYTHLCRIVAYWRDLPDEQLLMFKPAGNATEERLTGLLFSIMVMFDGSTLSLPGFDLVPRDTDEQVEEGMETDGERWPAEPINRGIELHAEFPFDRIPPQAS